jgi:hypothetical protein
MVVVRADEPELRSVAGDRLAHAIDVRLDGHPRPVRCHHDADGALDPVGAHPLNRLGDERRRVLHPEVRAERAVPTGVQLPLDPLCLLPREL